MASKEETKNTAPAQNTAPAPAQNTAPAPEPEFDMSQADGLANFASKLPQYDPGVDARDKRNIGKKGHPIHGYMLTTIDLPSVLKDKDGNLRPWIGIVIELLQACPVKEGTAQNPTYRKAKKGERIILTESTAFQRFSKAADHPTQVYETLIIPEVGLTKSGQSLWNFPEVRFGRSIPRRDNHLVGIADLLPDEVVHPALPMHAGASA